MRTSTYYIGIGSNEGDRLLYLQKALFRISDQLGIIRSVSSVYESPALGFEGENFLNACIELESEFTPERLLQACLELEKSFGRIRTDQGYANRPLDIDLLIGPTESNTASLELPHPRMSNRRFVIEPLYEIAPHLEIKSQSIKKIKNTLEKDPSQPITKTKTSILRSKKELWHTSKNVVLEGCIGVGKSTLCKAIAERYELSSRYERFDENPYLESFYKDPKAYALPVELHFLLDRFDALKTNQAAEGLVSDYHLSKSLLFAKNNLNEIDFELFNRYYRWGERLLKAPGLYVLLENNLDRILENIKKRGRSYEQNIDPDYLKSITKGYQDFIKRQKRWNILVIDLSLLPNYEDPNFLGAVIERIEDALLEVHWKKQTKKTTRTKKGLTLF
jgi:2-amino-4-hydroxy-6-hydroxymethyldihydropteridine diphosphokinase